MARRPAIETEEQAYEAAVRLLARKARTAAEVSVELESRGTASELIESVLGRLKSHRHVDDAALAGDQAFSLIEGKGMSPAAAVQTLVERGVGEAVAREAVEQAREGRSDRELCERALAKRTKGVLAEDRVGKEARALARLGYDEDVIERALERARRTE